MKPGTNQQGDLVWDLVCNPTEELIKQYRLKVNTQGDMRYNAQIPYEFVVLLNPDPSWTRYLCLVTYEGKITQASRILAGISQQQEILKLQKECTERKYLVEVYKEKMQLMEKNLPAYVKRNVTPFLQELTPFVSDMINKGKIGEK